MAEQTSPGELRRPWLGVLLSLLVPGFGLVRARRVGRGVAWFVTLHLLAIGIALLVIWRTIPTALVVAAFVVWVLAQLMMLIDSYRPGRLPAALWVVFAIIFVTAAVLPIPARLVVHAFKMPTGPMRPTLQPAAADSPADHFFADRLSYRFTKPKRGDLVVFRTDGISGIPAPHTIYVKRLVGLPGETIVIRDLRVFADGRELGPGDGVPAAIDYFNHRSTDESGFVVPENSYFVLGDNSRQSYDSRWWGAVPEANVFGRVARIYYPFARAGVPK